MSPKHTLGHPLKKHQSVGDMTVRKPSEKEFWVCSRCGAAMIETQELIEDIDKYLRKAFCTNCDHQVQDYVE